MTSPFIYKNFVRQICRFGGQNVSQMLQIKMNPEIKLDPELFREKILMLKHTAAANGLISLSANQISLKNRIFVILKKKLIRYGKWNNYEQLFQKNKPEECYQAIINPQLISYSNFKIKGDQQCSSIQGLKFKVWVPLTNKMKYVKFMQQNQRGRNKNLFHKTQQSLSGFYGRVFDHQFRHMEGILPNLPQICNYQVYLNDQYKVNPENYNFIKEYRLQNQFFNQQNMDKHIERQQQRMKQMVNKKTESNLGQKFDYNKLPDKIDDKLKQKLSKSYQEAMKASNVDSKSKLTGNRREMSQPGKNQRKAQSKQPNKKSKPFRK